MSEISLSSDGSTITVFLPMAWRRRGGRKVIVAPPGCDDWAPPPKIDRALLKALARAHRWRRMLEGGAYGTIAELADAEQISRSYVSRVLRLISGRPPRLSTRCGHSWRAQSSAHTTSSGGASPPRSSSAVSRRPSAASVPSPRSQRTSRPRAGSGRTSQPSARPASGWAAPAGGGPPASPLRAAVQPSPSGGGERDQQRVQRAGVLRARQAARGGQAAVGGRDGVQRGRRPRRRARPAAQETAVGDAGLEVGAHGARGDAGQRRRLVARQPGRAGQDGEHPAARRAGRATAASGHGGILSLDRHRSASIVRRDGAGTGPALRRGRRVGRGGRARRAPAAARRRAARRRRQPGTAAPAPASARPADPVAVRRRRRAMVAERGIGPRLAVDGAARQLGRPRLPARDQRVGLGRPACRGAARSPATGRPPAPGRSGAAGGRAARRPAPAARPRPAWRRTPPAPGWPGPAASPARPARRPAACPRPRPPGSTAARRRCRRRATAPPAASPPGCRTPACTAGTPRRTCAARAASARSRSGRPAARRPPPAPAAGRSGGAAAWPSIARSTYSPSSAPTSPARSALTWPLASLTTTIAPPRIAAARSSVLRGWPRMRRAVGIVEKSAILVSTGLMYSSRSCADSLS